MSASSEKITRDAAAAEPGDPMSLARMRRSPTHPGEVFREDYLESSVPDPEPGRRGAQGKQAAAARALGWSANRMNEFVLGKRPLTYEGALDLAELTKTSPEFWATLQMRHDLWHGMQKRRQKG